MFEGIGVSSLDVSTFDTSQVTSMTAMFRNAASITDLDLSNFNTSNVIGFSLMFAGMTNLVSLDLSSFDTSKEFGYLSAMFDGATMLKQLKLGTNIKKLYPVAALPVIPVSNMYTGYWQNVGSGTVDNPKGTTILTSAELLRTYAGERWRIRMFGKNKLLLRSKSMIQPFIREITGKQKITLVVH